jgi:Zn-dependent protease with chaperone function
VGLGLGQLVTLPLQLALLKWSRCAELTCDRAGLLACRDLGASLRLLLTLCGGQSAASPRFDLAAFVAQARELEQLQADDALDGLVGAFLELGRSHPLPAWRLMHLVQWAERGSYLELLARGDAA